MKSIFQLYRGGTDPVAAIFIILVLLEIGGVLQVLIQIEHGRDGYIVIHLS